MIEVDTEQRGRGRTPDDSQLVVGARRSPWMFLAAVVVAAGFGVFAGWVAWGSTGDEPTYVIPGATDLSERQAEMIEIAEQYLAAWTATDGDLAATFMTENGVVEYPSEGWRFEVADGSMQRHVTDGPYSTLEQLAPMVVHENRILLTGRINDAGVSWVSVVHFTGGGDVRIISESIYYWG